ncbi:MAG: hypothetical protein R2867_05000 [Caldilineaceae bacterium]
MSVRSATSHGADRRRDNAGRSRRSQARLRVERPVGGHIAQRRRHLIGIKQPGNVAQAAAT